MKRCLTSLVFSEMQIGPTMSYHYMTTRITFKRQTKQSIVENNQLKSSYTTWECKIVHPLHKAVYGSHLSYNPGIPLLGSHPREKMYICPLKYLYVNVYCSSNHKSPTWKQPKCSSTGK